MAATHFSRLSDPEFLFVPQYITGSVLHRYDVVTRSCYHYANVTAAGLGENILSPESDIANFERTLLEFRELIFTKFSGSLDRLCGSRTQSKNRKSVDRVPSKSRPNYSKKPKKPDFKPPNLPQMRADSPPNKNHFFTVARAIRCMDHVGVRIQSPKVLQPPIFYPHCSNSTNLNFTKYSRGHKVT